MSASAFVRRASKDVKSIVLVDASRLKQWLSSASASQKKWVKENAFEGSEGEVLVVPGEDGARATALVGASTSAPDIWTFAALPSTLKRGTWSLSDDLSPEVMRIAALGWGIGAYAFTRYQSEPKTTDAKLVWPAVDEAEVERLVEAVTIGRDLVTTPAEDMGPQELEDEAKRLAKLHNGNVSVIRGSGLITKKYPAVHAVGRAAATPPRLIDLKWGNANAPKVTLVGKGVVFDTGGLDLKSAAGMILMKKDMGGAAMVLALAHAIMDAKLNVRLRVLVPAVENSVSGNAMRPSDVLQTRKGITVEVGNTDAEGRLILSDALCEATRENPDLVVDFATLTGAARVALGTELPALFCNDDAMAEGIVAAGLSEQDPVWRMPLHQPYARFLKSSIADTNNISSTSYGGAITAALFLQKFIENDVPWAHIDLMAYNTDDRPGRPKGGEAMAIRAVYRYLADRYGAKAGATKKKAKRASKGK